MRMMTSSTKLMKNAFAAVTLLKMSIVSHVTKKNVKTARFFSRNAFGRPVELTYYR